MKKLIKIDYIVLGEAHTIEEFSHSWSIFCMTCGATSKRYDDPMEAAKDFFNGSCFFYYVGDNFIVELSICDGFLDYKNSLMNEWKRHGFITERFESYLHTNTYYCEDGKCSGKYNVMDKNSKVDFDYLLENTEDNIKYLVAKCIQCMKSGKI